jgi:hypothetical protein
MLTTKEIFDLLDKCDHSGGNDLYFTAARLYRRETIDVNEASAAQLSLLDKLASIQITSFVEEYRHPAAGVATSPRPRGSLTEAERDWLRRLPVSEPFMIDRDAVRKVAALLKAMRDDPLARDAVGFVESVWAPIDLYHRRKVAEAAVQVAAQADFTMWPKMLVEAVADAMPAEDPDSTPAGRLIQAADAVADYKVQRAERRAGVLRRARADLAALMSGAAA